MTEPSTRVCPRCGSAAGDNEYCGTCGLHLFEQPELPTREDWERTQAAEQVAPGPVSSTDTGPRGPGRAAAWFRRLNTQARIVLVAVAAALVAIPIVIATSSGKTESASRDSSPVSDQPAEPSAAEECVDKWNSDASESAKRLAGQIARSVGGGETSTYVSAGFSVDVPDRCLITVAQPDLGDGIAFQFAQTAQGTFEFPLGGTKSIAALPDSVKQWDARGDSQGNLTFGAP